MVTGKPALPMENFSLVRVFWQFDKPVEMNESAFLEELNKLTKKSLSAHTHFRSVLTHKDFAHSDRHLISAMNIISASSNPTANWIFSSKPVF